MRRGAWGALRGLGVGVLTVGLLVASRTWAGEPPPEVLVPDFYIEADPTSNTGEASGSRDEVSIDAVLKTSVYVASRRPQLMRETPGVVTVVTREEILASGARDLMDVLILVPGFAFGVDVQGGVGVGFRGNWGHEGKVLLLVDGQEMNELGYSTTQFGRHYPVEMIDKIEIIRGPGSAVYGGFAELAVINVITRDPKRASGLSLALRYGQMAESFGHRTLSLSAGQQAGDLAVSLSATLGQGVRSDATYVDAKGASWALGDDARTDPRFINLGIRFDKLRLRLIYDGYQTRTRDAFGESSADTDAQGFTGWFAEATYDWALRESVTITPKVSYKRQSPWQVLDHDSEIFFDKTYERLVFALGTSADPLSTINVAAGLEYRLDRGRLNDAFTGGLNSLFGDAMEVSYRNLTAYAQATLSHPWVNLTLGARWEKHSQFGASFVPRVGITKVFGRYHVKALASTAFRAPGFENINLNAELEAERTKAFELEFGVQLGHNLFVALNAFDITISKAIVYTTVESVEGYFNSNRAGTRGLEAEAKGRYTWGFVNASLSLYSAAGRNEVDLYAVPGDDRSLLGLPRWKGTAQAGVSFFDHRLTLGPSIAVMSERFGMLASESGESAVKAYPALVLVNLFANYTDLGVRGLELGIGVHNLLDADNPFVQPYDGGHPPLPGPSRELVARLAFGCGF